MRNNKEMLIKRIQESKDEYLIEKMLLTIEKEEHFRILKGLVNNLLETCDCTLVSGSGRDSWQVKIDDFGSIDSEGLYIENKDKGFGLVLDSSTLRLVARIVKTLEEMEEEEEVF